MPSAIGKVEAEMRLAQLLGEDDLFAQAPVSASPTSGASIPATNSTVPLTGNAFEDLLSKAIESLDGVSKSEVYANQMVSNYVKGEADLQEVMVAQAKMNITVQLAVTSINSAVNTFKEITQMQV